MTQKIEIFRIDCDGTSDPAGKDEVFLICQSDGGAPLRYPFPPFKTNAMAKDDQWAIGDSDDWPALILEFEHEVNVTLWEQDHKLDPDTTDFLGNMCVDQAGLTSPVKVWNGNDGKYKVHWRYA